MVVTADEKDRRTRRPHLTERGRAVLQAAVPIWRGEHGALEAALPDIDAPRLRTMLGADPMTTKSRGTKWPTIH